MRLAAGPADGDAHAAEATEKLGAGADSEPVSGLDTTAAYLEALAHSDRVTVAASVTEPSDEPVAESAAEEASEAPLAAVVETADDELAIAEVAADEPAEAPADAPAAEPAEEPEEEATLVIEEPEDEGIEKMPEEVLVEVEGLTEAAGVSQDAADLADVDDPSGLYDQFTTAPSPFVVLQQDEMSFYHDRSDDGWEQSASSAQRYVPGGQRRMQEDIEHHSGPPMLIVAGVAVAIMVIVCTLLFRVLGLSEVEETSETTQIVGTVVSKDEGEEIIASLDGWWKTDRVLDGRFWHIEKKSVQTYAADGKLASENMLDVTKVERMATGPGGIDKPGYYLRDVGFYLADGEPDTLYALAADGSADEDANLMRTEEPTFQEAKEEPEEPEPDTSEYVLPESDTRVYEYTELDGMEDYDLFLARNEIVARHGCIFRQGGELEAYFTQKSWYQPNEYYSDGDLTEIETQNLEVIRSVEYNHNSPYQWN